ncbi:MFS transporter [Stieleria varia]|uniref:MFS transporter n=1 Tax=Stieleria varia TaxID=2528005 RepID=UPI0036F367AC
MSTNPCSPPSVSPGLPSPTITSPDPASPSPDPSSPSPDPASPWAPLRNPVYRLFWIASLVSNIGTWMHEIGAGWLMAELNDSPQMVSAVRTAMATPIVLLAIPAGVLADRINRRHLLLLTQSLMLCSTALLAVLTFSGVIREWSLLTLTFMTGLGMTLHVPTWQASIPELVPRKQLSRAIALGSISFNLARAVGPAIAGSLIALLGVWVAFSINAASFAGVIAVLLIWKRNRSESTRGLSFGRSLYQGLRYVYRKRAIRHALISVLLFVVPASALWSLLPLVAKTQLEWGPTGFGVLVGMIGVGAVLAARVLPRIQSRFGNDRTALAAMLGFALGLFSLASTNHPVVVAFATVIMGGSWMTVLTTLNTTVQVHLPGRMRARGMSCYLTAIAISMSLGSMTWGTIAEHLDVTGAQKIAAATIVVTAAIRTRFRLGAWH